MNMLFYMTSIMLVKCRQFYYFYLIKLKTILNLIYIGREILKLGFIDIENVMDCNFFKFALHRFVNLHFNVDTK